MIYSIKQKPQNSLFYSFTLRNLVILSERMLVKQHPEVEESHTTSLHIKSLGMRSLDSPTLVKQAGSYRPPLARDDKHKTGYAKLKNIFPVKKYRVYGNSMSPTLNAGNMILVCKYFFYKPKTGDMIAALDPRNGKTIIKRITKIENRKYFVEGDNKTASTDSRDFGLLDKDNIIGKVVFVL